jgi:hypothetical protein
MTPLPFSCFSTTLIRSKTPDIPPFENSLSYTSSQDIVRDSSSLESLVLRYLRHLFSSPSISNIPSNTLFLGPPPSESNDHFCTCVKPTGDLTSGRLADGFNLNGPGLKRFADGSLFIGNFENDTPHGQGILHDNANTTHDGIFIQGCPANTTNYPTTLRSDLPISPEELTDALMSLNGLPLPELMVYLQLSLNSPYPRMAKMLTLSSYASSVLSTLPLSRMDGLLATCSSAMPY